MTEQYLAPTGFERPLAEGLVDIAKIAGSEGIYPGDAYVRFRNWAADRGLCGHDRLDTYGFPHWENGIYVSTSITSGGMAREEGITVPEAAAANTAVAEALTMQVISDNDLDPRQVLLSTDLPHVKGWSQADYLLFWLANMGGIPVDAGVGDKLINSLARSDVAAGLAEPGLTKDEKWGRYEALVRAFDDECDKLRIYSRNDYYAQTSRPGTMLQLIDTRISLGCRAEELYARLRNIEISRLVIRTERIGQGPLATSLGKLGALGATTGLPEVGALVVSSR